MMSKIKRSSFEIQKSVIGSLLLREIITRYGRNNIGFLWLFVEPLLLTLVILGLWVLTKANKFSDLNIVAFMITGYPISMMWRNAARRCVNAIETNSGLLFHRNVRVIDVFSARVLLEIAGSTISIIGIFVVFVVFGLIPAPNNALLMILSWFLMSWFSLSLGLIIGVLSELYEIFGQLWKTISFFLVPASGAVFFVESLPVNAQKFMLWVPMVHGTEMFRHGYFGSTFRTHESISYMIMSNIILLFVGLLLVQKFSRGVEPS